MRRLTDNQLDRMTIDEVRQHYRELFESNEPRWFGKDEMYLEYIRDRIEIMSWAKQPYSHADWQEHTSVSRHWRELLRIDPDRPHSLIPGSTALYERALDIATDLFYERYSDADQMASDANDPIFEAALEAVQWARLNYGKRIPTE